MTVLDLVIIAIVLLSAAIGAWRGFVEELMALAAWVAALGLAWFFGADFGGKVFAAIGDPALRTVAGSAALVVVVLIGAALLKLALHRLFKALGLTFSDRVLGVMFGLARGAFVVFLFVAIAGVTSVPQQSWWRAAVLAAPFETAVLAARPLLPPDIARRVRF